MKLLSAKFIGYSVIAVIFLTSCGEIRPVWKEERKLDDFTLEFQTPCEFQIALENATEPVTVKLELAITYYVGISRTSLPLYLVIEDENHNIQEFTPDIQIKREGKWIGTKDENEVDYTITHEAISAITFEKGTYSLKIYSNDENSEQVDGIIKISVRLFELEPEE
ncbi:MAG: hypothetical protein AAFY71_11205 [Bacteroidota bacterium]